MIQSALKNPYAVVAISVIVVILGVVSFQNMVVDVFPEINLPVVAVATFYKGMGPSEIEGAITLRLEQLFLQASYVEHIESKSLPGVSLIKVYFQSSYNVNDAMAEITSLTYSALRYLPQGVFPPIIIKFGAASLPIGTLTVDSESRTEKEVRDLAYFTVRPQLGSVPGIFVAPSFGGTVRQITVFLDQERMLARGLSINEVVSAVNAQSLLLPAGNVKIGGFDYNVYTNSMIKLVEDMNQIPIKVVNGVPVTLAEVGRAVDSTMVQSNIVRINGNRSVYLPILKQAGANTLQVIDGVKEALPKLLGLPKDLSVKLIFDQSLYVRQAIKTLEHEGLLGGGLACLMILVFLGSVRYTIVIALAIPISVLAAFVLLYFTGQTVNLMTLGGLALVIGTLLDDNIVVLENVHRHLGLGKTLHQAAGDGVREVALPMLVAMISTLIVYLPIVFFTGIVKFLFIPLALAVAYAMIAAYLASMTVAPVAIVALTPQSAAHAHHSGSDARLFDRLFARFTDRYERLLRWCLRHKIFVMLAVAGIFTGSMLLAPRLATEFFPKVDAGQFILNVAAPEGTRVENTEALVAQIEDILRQEIRAGDLDQIVANIGLPQGWMVMFTPVNGPHQAFVMVSLAAGHRERTDVIIDRLRKRFLEQWPGLKFSFQTGGIVSDVINFGLPAPIDIKVSGPNLKTVADAAARIKEVAARVPGTTDVQVKQGMEYPELRLEVDREKASYMGLNQRQIVTDFTTGLSSNLQLSPGYWIDPKSNNAYFVVAQYPEQSLVTFEDFLNTPLVGTNADRGLTANAVTTLNRGSTMALQQAPFSQQPARPQGGSASATPILLRELVDVKRQTGPEVIDHYNLQRTVDVLTNVAGNDLGRIAGRIESALAGVHLPEDVKLLMKGEVDGMRAALKGFAGVLPLAMVLIYLVMVGLFRSYLDPLVIMFAVPLGFIGVIAMLLLTNTSVNVQSLIGTLMMIGVVVSNSVLLVDFANRRMLDGLSAEEAVVEAGRLRIRPIIMTSLATILGLTPMALGLGEGSEANMPLARAVIGGLLVSTVMTLFFIPVLHAGTRRGRHMAPEEAA
ncbi:efflux RND transporter permease subunit [Nitrospira moscoviensis]|uniref:RND-type permease AcrB n=1 Tax=Nitrospira moscoviensis TaxID=42253 RepID=A0A0K2GDJ6_NITMO|nr:efflux RND transporter permease subunit [Nitrospira moscoviensis]ALA58914.1 RND-type permease AcrB [Nitrospira moscoviensis]